MLLHSLIPHHHHHETDTHEHKTHPEHCQLCELNHEHSHDCTHDHHHGHQHTADFNSSDSEDHQHQHEYQKIKHDRITCCEIHHKDEHGHTIHCHFPTFWKPEKRSVVQAAIILTTLLDFSIEEDPVEQNGFYIEKQITPPYKGPRNMRAPPAC
ncbi:hypothetical protein EYV94_17875 [Puteibacter caeruleilacunae]|nr:hypothetical protein EYV94_17875 [Puteibacter caeruleilacunae]